MGLVVQKFGGSSVADADKIRNVANCVIKEKNKGNQVVVVVSAMGKTTNYLMELAKEISQKPDLRELDVLLTTGEQVSIAMLSMALIEKGYKAVSLNAMQIGIITENIHNKARIVDVKTDKLKQKLNEDNIVVVAGFQGVTPEGEITTLGRGGSDTSAVAIAAALNADRCDIYTDVDGVYTADPRVVSNATRLDKILYAEMLELARVGAKVLHPRSVETAKQFDVKLRVRSSFNHDDLGTLVVGAEDMEIYRPVSGVAADLTQIRISVTHIPDTPGTAAALFGKLADNNVSVDMIIQTHAKTDSTNDIDFTVGQNDLQTALRIVEAFKKEFNSGEILIDENIAKVSIVGAGMIDRPGIAANMFRALAEAQINIKMISTSEIKISCVIDKQQADKAVKSLHTKFDLDQNQEIAKVYGL
ncbi:MAG: aspartate kinase [Candidatus Gastranaerophilales bacterium]|nr:aspartate kinase [Candidatus Gastranaerophilales bacterium]